MINNKYKAAYSSCINDICAIKKDVVMIGDSYYP
jgi:hypothetical protein